MASLDFYCTASSDDIESINHDRLMALYHVGTDVKRSLLQHYLSEKNLNLANYLSKRYDCIPSDDVKRVTRTKNIQLSDLGVYAIDTLLMKHCYDMFWDCCLDKSSLDHILYTNNTELYRLYQNDLQQDHESPNGLRTLKNLSSTQWSFIIRKIDYQTSSIIPKKGLQVTAFDDDMHFVLLRTVCPLYKSVQVVTENQMKISRLAVEHGINNDDYQKIWELMEKKLNTMSSYCNCAGYFKPKLDTLKTSTFNREQTRDNRKYILDSTFDNPTLLKDSEFVDRVQNELKLIKEEETKSSICTHCARKIIFSLDNGKYIPGSYPSALADLAKKDLECCQSVCSRLNVHQNLISTSETIDALGQQKIIDRNNYLKLVCLIQEVAKQVLFDVLKGRLPGADLGNALKGMKDRLLPSLNDVQKQKMYPEGSKYNGDLSDIDISLLCIILRKLNTICEHKNGWGKVPEEDDRSISANIDRIRIAKNMIVSHPSICSMESTEFNKSWEAIRQCCVDLGGDKYEEKIDMLLTSSLDCGHAQKVAESLINEKENDYKNERYARKFEEMVDSVKQMCDTVQRNIKCTERQKTTHNTKNGTLIGIKIEGDQLPSTTDTKIHIEHFNSEDVCVKSVEDGCLMITLEMFSSAFEHFGYFLAVIDKLLQHIFPAKTVSVDKSFKAINISVKLYQLVEESKWHRPDLEGKTTKRNTDDNTVMEADKNETIIDLQNSINRHSHLKVVQLITNIARDVLVDVLKSRLPSPHFGYALNGMKHRILPLLNNRGRHLLYPNMSTYSGDLSDLDISLLYIILRNLNTIIPHSNGWENMPKDNDRTVSANIDRIRFFKHKYVSHCSTESLDAQDFLQTWEEISKCIIELGGAEYKSKIDCLFTSEISPVMDQGLLHTLIRLKETEEQNESCYFKYKEKLNEIKQIICMTNTKPADTERASNASLGSVPCELKIEGSNIPLVEEIKKHIDDLSSDDMRVTFVKEGSIIIGLKVSASALHTVEKFVGKIDTLLSKLLQMYPHYGNGHTSQIVASLNFMDEQNVPIGFPIKQNFWVVATAESQNQIMFRKDLEKPMTTEDIDALNIMAARFEQKEIRLLLTGKTGCGKSLLANSVFNENIFEAKCQPASVTKICQSHSQMIHGTEVTVIDTPGFFDTNNDIDIDSKMAHCIELSIPGPHVILNVVSIGRFTQEDFNAIRFFKEKFGDDVSKYCLLVLTRFDDYKRDTGMTDFNFESFITHLPFEYQSMLKSTFGNRYMPFDNTLSGNSGRDQELHLMKKVNKIIADNNDSHYTNNDFEKAEKAMKKRKEELEKERCKTFNLTDFFNVIGSAATSTMQVIALFDTVFGNNNNRGNENSTNAPELFTKPRTDKNAPKLHQKPSMDRNAPELFQKLSMAGCNEKHRELSRAANKTLNLKR